MAMRRGVHRRPQTSSSTSASNPPSWAVEAEAVPGCRLHQRGRLLQHGTRGGGTQLGLGGFQQVDSGGNPAVSLGEEEQLIQPVDQERGAVRGVEHDLADRYRARRRAAGERQLGQRQRRLPEETSAMLAPRSRIAQLAHMGQALEATERRMTSSSGRLVPRGAASHSSAAPRVHPP